MLFLSYKNFNILFCFDACNKFIMVGSSLFCNKRTLFWPSVRRTFTNKFTLRVLQQICVFTSVSRAIYPDDSPVK